MNFNEVGHKPVFTLTSRLSGSQNQKKGTRAPKIPKHTAATWGEAPPPPPATAWDCDEYSLPMERRYGGGGVGWGGRMHALLYSAH